MKMKTLANNVRTVQLRNLKANTFATGKARAKTQYYKYKRAPSFNRENPSKRKESPKRRVYFNSSECKDR